MRQHNDVNVLCLSGKNTAAGSRPRKFSTRFIAAKFEGGRHERRVHKMDVRLRVPPQLRLRNVDPDRGRGH